MQRQHFYPSQLPAGEGVAGRIAGRRQQRQFLRYDSKKFDDVEHMTAERDLSPGATSHHGNSHSLHSPYSPKSPNRDLNDFPNTPPGGYRQDYLRSTTPSSPHFGHAREHPVRDTESEEAFPPPYSSYDSHAHSPHNSTEYNPRSVREALESATLDRSTISSRGYLEDTPDYRNINQSTLSPSQSVPSVQEHNLINASLSRPFSPPWPKVPSGANINRSSVCSPTYADTKSLHSNYGELNRSIHSNYADLNPNINQSVLSSRSILSRNTYDNKSILSRNTLDNKSVMSRRTLGTPSHVRSTESIATHKQNGGVQLSEHYHSKQSLSLSQHSTSSQRVKLYGPGYGVHNSLVNLGFVALLAVVLCMVAIQLMSRLRPSEASGRAADTSILRSSQGFSNTRDVAVVLCSLIIMLDMCCLLLAVLQIYFAAKLLKCSQGEERAFRYLKECSPTRFVAVSGFIISIPVLLIVVILYTITEFGFTSAVVSVVILVVGLLFAVATIIHSTIYWRQEKEKTYSNVKSLDGKSSLNNELILNQSGMSTLV